MSPAAVAIFGTSPTFRVREFGWPPIGCRFTRTATDLIVVGPVRRWTFPLTVPVDTVEIVIDWRDLVGAMEA